MITRTYTARPDGKCCICKEDQAVTRGKLFCDSCQEELIRREREPVRTYVGYERVGRKQLNRDRFDWDYTDFDAEYSLGGRPDYDAWFPPSDEGWNGILD